MAAPPVDAGAVQDTLAVPLPALAVASFGAPGTVFGVTADEAPEAEPAPAALVAVTVNVYDVPLVRPVTVHEVAPVVVHVFEPGVEVTV